MSIKIHTTHQNGEGVNFSTKIKQAIQPSFIMLILGRPGSGKSTILTHLLTSEMYLSRKFGRIIYVTPTQLKHESIMMNQSNWRKQFDEKWIKSKIQQCNQNKVKNALFVFDDVIAKWSLKQNRTFIKQFIWNRRHLIQKGTISIIITSQRYYAVPTDVRASLTTIIGFNQNNKQANSIYLDANSDMQQHEFRHHLTNLKKGDYLIMNCIKGKMFNKNLKKL